MTLDLEDKALRFDLDAAGIESREREAVELVELRAEVARLRDDAKIASALHRELNDIFGWGDESLLHASLHVRNAVQNLRTDLRTERFLLENSDKIADSRAEDERKDVVAYLRERANAPHPTERGRPALSPAGRGLLLLMADRIERGEHRK